MLLRGRCPGVVGGGGHGRGHQEGSGGRKMHNSSSCILPTSSSGAAAALERPRRAGIRPQVASTDTAAAATSSSDAVAATRQTYIQESINFTGAELAARLPSMQTALRAQRDAAAAGAAAAASAAYSAVSRSVMGGRAPGVPPVPPVTRPGPHPAAATVAAAASAGGPAAPYSSSSTGGSSSGAFGGISMSPMAAAAAASASAASTMQVAEPVAEPAPYSNGYSSAVLEQEQYELPQQLEFQAQEEEPQQEQEEQEVLQQYEEPPAEAAEAYSGGYDSDSNAGAAAGGYSSMQGLSPSEKMQALQQVQQASYNALTKQSSNPYYVNAPKTIDIRMYDQLVLAHNKQSQKLSDINSHVGVLEGQINRCNEDLIAAFELLKQIAMEFGTTSRLAQGTAAAVQFGVDPQDALDKISALQERLSTLEQAVLEQRAEFGKRVVRKVPVEWIGVASEVKVMGDFDDWTRGQELSAEDVASDSVYCRFEGTLLLRPGKYRVKFMVDNEWRLAADWPTERDEHGNEVCLLTVA